jgi:hypothetical protein
LVPGAILVFSEGSTRYQMLPENISIFLGFKMRYFDRDPKKDFIFQFLGNLIPVLEAKFVFFFFIHNRPLA